MVDFLAWKTSELLSSSYFVELKFQRETYKIGDDEANFFCLVLNEIFYHT